MPEKNSLEEVLKFLDAEKESAFHDLEKNIGMGKMTCSELLSMLDTPNACELALKLLGDDHRIAPMILAAWDEISFSQANATDNERGLSIVFHDAPPLGRAQLFIIEKLKDRDIKGT